ncbi:MAG: glycosyl transferase [Bacteroidetes bacterium]|nr:MAG: glycosyl transferase [Bacteroidota bacterium]
MKILYAIQGTGNGHVSRAREIVPILAEFGELDLFLSGENSQVDLPFPIKYRSKGLSLYYDKKGGLDYLKIFSKFKSRRLVKEIRDFPIKKYDLIINDFEFITAYAAKLRKKACVGFGHQASFLSPNTPRPEEKSYLGEFLLKNYAPCTTAVGLHFDNFDSFIHKPVIRSEVRELKIKEKEHFSVYLPHYDDEELIKFFKKRREVEWHIFSKNVRHKERRKNIKIYPVQSEKFLRSMASSKGVITGAGFETPAEAIYLGKKLMTIPIAGQYEQVCNAEALKKLGVTVIKKINKEFDQKLSNWLENTNHLQISYPDQTAKIIENMVTEHGNKVLLEQI